MAAGLGKVLSMQQPGSKLAEVLGPLVGEVKAQLSEVKGHDSVAKKAAGLDAAQAIMQKVAESIANRGKALVNESRTDKTNLLMGVLLSRQHNSMEEQYSVLEDPQFHTLPAVKFV